MESSFIFWREESLTFQKDRTKVIGSIRRLQWNLSEI